MAKAKSHNSVSRVSQKHLYSRISYLSQAAAYLASSEEKSRILASVKGVGGEVQLVHDEKSSRVAYMQSRHLLSQLRAVSLKSQIRLTTELKHSFCKRCDSLLVPARTSEIGVTNESRLGEKPWADVLVVTCTFCGRLRRYPIGQNGGRRGVVASVEAKQGVDDLQQLLEQASQTGEPSSAEKS